MAAMYERYLWSKQKIVVFLLKSKYIFDTIINTGAVQTKRDCRASLCLWGSDDFFLSNCKN